MSKFLLAGAAAVALLTFISLPASTTTLAELPALAKPARGAIHVHTSRSDGSGTIEQVAQAASRAGLDFVIITDHGDGSRRIEDPAYHSGVLCIDAVEISTWSGHVVALGLKERAPYLLGGEARDVVADVARLGGMSIAAHPSSQKDGLRWNDWSVPVDGVEWVNADSEWRDESPFELGRALLTYPWRRSETLAAMLDRPEELLRRWDTMGAGRRVVAIAGADAHANLGLGTSHPNGDRALLAIPSYERSFRTFSVSLPALRLSRNPIQDADAVVAEIRTGRVYSSIDAFATPARLRFVATSGTVSASGGETLAPAGPVAIEVASNGPADAEVVLYKDGREVARSAGPTLSFTSTATDRGSYRSEVYLPRQRDVPWLLSNPIHIGAAFIGSEPAQSQALATQVVYGDGPDGDGWGVEKSAAASGVHDIVSTLQGTRVRVRYALAGSTAESAYVALGMPAGKGLERHDRVIFQAEADKPMRIWLQLWMQPPSGNQYWRRSVYLDETEREIVVPLSELTAVPGSPERPPLDRIQSLMFVVDQTHTPLGQSGSFWIDNVRYGRPK